MTIVLVTFGVIFPCLLYEIFLRFVGYKPLSPATHASIFRFSHAYEDDALLGWKLVPGYDTFAPVSDEAHETHARILQQGDRATRENDFAVKTPTRGAIVFVGDSFTFGDGLQDQETYPWLVQHSLKNYDIKNLAVPGYGTCQTYLELQQLLSDAKYDGATVIYGMSDFHEARNLPDLRTAWSFAAMSPRKIFHAPSCLLDGAGQLITRPVQEYRDPIPLLSENLSIGRRMVHIYYDLLDLPNRSLKRPLSYSLLKNISELTKKHQQHFVVLMQRFEPQAQLDYLNFLQETSISSIDGSHPLQMMPGMQIAGDGHPNASMNMVWAERVVNYLKGLKG